MTANTRRFSPPKQREQRREEKEKPKKSLHEACIDLKRAASDRRREAAQREQDAKREEEYEALMLQIHGPRKVREEDQDAA